MILIFWNIPSKLCQLLKLAEYSMFDFISKYLLTGICTIAIPYGQIMEDDTTLIDS